MSCQQILNTMRAGDEVFSFGPRGDPEAGVALPFLLVSGEWLGVSFLFVVFLV